MTFLSPTGQIVGYPVNPLTISPQRISLDGKFIRLDPLNVERDLEDLWDCSHGSPEKEQIWTYLFDGPFANKDLFTKWLKENEKESTDKITFSVLDKKTNKRIGMISYLNIVSNMGRIEIGSIWYAGTQHRTKTNTESCYLLIKNAFEECLMRRVEWKCNNLNEPSKKAATRLGFQYEGLFRKHMVIKQRNRDTAWYSMLDEEWELCKISFETWLYTENVSQEGLESIRNRLAVKRKHEKI